MTAAELIAVLSIVPPDAQVLGTWEGIRVPVGAVYVTADGEVVIDVDDDELGAKRHYEARHIAGGGRRVWP